MGWLVMAVGLTILIITGSYQNQQMSETTKRPAICKCVCMGKSDTNDC